MKKTLLIGLLTVLTMTLSACDSKPKTAIMTTNFGDITISLYNDEAPLTTDNFIELAKDGKYDDTIFHRVIDGFMIQGGDFENRNGTGGYSAQGPDTLLQDEFTEGLTHERGAISMANTGAPNSGGSQFFIVQAKDGTTWLDGKHAIFGKVTEGMDVVDKIASVQTLPGDRPVEDVVLEKVTLK